MALNASWQRRPAAPVRAAHQATALTPATPGQCANHRPTLTMAGSDQLFWLATRASTSAGRSPGSNVATSADITSTAVAMMQRR